MNRRHLSLIACFVLLLFAVTTTQAADAARKPNVVFILADDLGWTDLGCQGSTYYKTPNIDKLAAGGLRFTHGYTCGPNCQPTRAALMTGQYGARTGVYTVGGIDRFDWKSRPLRPVDNVQKLPLDRKTVGDVMKAAGYATGMFGKWHLGQDPEHHPSKRGFDEAIVSMDRHFDFATDPKVDYPKGTYLADFLTDQAVGFIEAVCGINSVIQAPLLPFWANLYGEAQVRRPLSRVISVTRCVPNTLAGMSLLCCWASMGL